MSIIIKGGTIVNEGKTFVGDVVIEGEQIASVSPSISTSTSSSTVIDATGSSRARAGQQRQAA